MAALINRQFCDLTALPLEEAPFREGLEDADATKLEPTVTELIYSSPFARGKYHPRKVFLSGCSKLRRSQCPLRRQNMLLSKNSRKLQVSFAWHITSKNRRGKGNSLNFSPPCSIDSYVD